MIRRRERVMAVLWPSFLMAGVLEMLVFAFVDPTQLHLFGGAPLEWSPTAVYTTAFFVFWGVIAAAAAMTELLELGAEEINRAGVR
jgi:hypothetical protein